MRARSEPFRERNQPDNLADRENRLAILRHARTAHAEAGDRHAAEQVERILHLGELELEGGELKEGMNSGELIIHDSRDKDVKGAKVTVTPWMPGMGHGVPEVPVVTEKEKMFGSQYFLKNLMINMGGHWEILVEVEKDGVKDGAVFDFPAVGGKGMNHGMKMEKHAMPADLDFSPIRTSEEKTFTVSYESTPSPPPLNKIHSWRLTVKTAAGAPVTGAMIMVDGGMPEHGHGAQNRVVVAAQ